jgi:hypothetical protein
MCFTAQCLRVILTNEMILDSAHLDSISEVFISEHISAASVIPCIQNFGSLYPWNIVIKLHWKVSLKRWQENSTTVKKTLKVHNKLL